MSVLIDTGVLYADHDLDATRHEAASAALDYVYDGELGQPYVSDFIYDEAVTLTANRSGRTEEAITLGKRIRGADPYVAAFELQPVSEGDFDEAIDVFERFSDQRLSFTDATIVAQVRRDNVDGVLSFDSDFDGIVERYDPNTMAVR